MTGYEPGWQWFICNIKWQDYNIYHPFGERPFSLFTKPNTGEDKPITQLILNNYKLGG